MIDRIIEDMTITYTRTVFFSEFRDIKSVDFYNWKFEVQNSRVFSNQAIVFVYTIVAMNKQCVAQVHWKNAFVC